MVTSLSHYGTRLLHPRRRGSSDGIFIFGPSNPPCEKECLSSQRCGRHFRIRPRVWVNPSWDQIASRSLFTHTDRCTNTSRTHRVVRDADEPTKSRHCAGLNNFPAVRSTRRRIVITRGCGKDSRLQCIRFVSRNWGISVRRLDLMSGWLDARVSCDCNHVR